MSKRIYLSVIIPCYNEAANLKKGALVEVAKFLEKQSFTYEVIISDDGSIDESCLLAEKFVKENRYFRLLKNKHGGKPWAVWKGIEAASGKLVLFTDMDQSTPIIELNKLAPYFDQGFDIVIGSRGLKREGFPLIRQIASSVFRFLRGFVLLPGITDTQCGFKMFKTKAVKEIFPRLQFFKDFGKEVKGWRVSAFDVELLYLAKKRGYKIKEVVVNWKDRDLAVKGKKKKFVNESWEMAKEILRVKLNDLKGKYDK